MATQSPRWTDELFGDPNPLPYTQANVDFMIVKLKTWVAKFRQRISDGDDKWTRALSRLFALKVSPRVAADECIAVSLTTVELQANGDGETLWRPIEAALHGGNPSLYAVMNWSCRAFRAVSASCDDRTATLLRATIRIFHPLMMRVDAMLSRLPASRSVLYRGVNNVGYDDVCMSKKYASGCYVAWHQPSSTSEDWNVAKKIRQHEFHDPRPLRRRHRLFINDSQRERVAPAFLRRARRHGRDVAYVVAHAARAR